MNDKNVLPDLSQGDTMAHPGADSTLMIFAAHRICQGIAELDDAAAHAGSGGSAALMIFAAAK